MNRIRTRLMISILIAALLPALPTSLVVRNLLERSRNPVLQAVVSDGLDAGMEASREDLRRRKADFTAAAEKARRQAAGRTPPASGQLILDEKGRPQADAPPVPALWGTTARWGRSPQLIAGHLAVLDPGAAGGEGVVIAQRLPAAAVQRAESIKEAMSLVAALQLERGAALRSYILPFLLVYAVMILIALSVAAVLANRLAAPLEAVAEGAKRVAGGDLDTQVDLRPGGETGALVQAFNDMVRRLAEQRTELARLEKLSAWRGMARILAHEIKNPLTPILLAVQEANRSYDGSDERHAAVLQECETIVTEEVEGLRELVRSFSDFARPPRPELRREDLPALLDHLARLYGDRLQVRPPALDMHWFCDGGQIRRALINLIDNGLAASERAGNEPCVTVSASAGETELLLAVRDGGDGIAPADRARIFEPDFTTGSQGMGLGLPIVAGIAAGHAGRIELESPPQGGSIFTLILPRRTEEEKA